MYFKDPINYVFLNILHAYMKRKYLTGLLAIVFYYYVLIYVDNNAENSTQYTVSYCQHMVQILELSFPVARLPLMATRRCQCL